MYTNAHFVETNSIKIYSQSNLYHPKYKEIRQFLKIHLGK